MKLLVATAALILPTAAQACAVCGAATENNQMAFLAMTLFMSLMPLAAIGGIAWWVWRRTKALDAEAPDY